MGGNDPASPQCELFWLPILGDADATGVDLTPASTCDSVDYRV